jgi:hypothetical protein
MVMVRSIPSLSRNCPRFACSNAVTAEMSMQPSSPQPTRKSKAPDAGAVGGGERVGFGRPIRLRCSPGVRRLRAPTSFEVRAMPVAETPCVPAA